ncbi:MAG: hypothetical protein E7013_01385 [Alphaproteobacteria bacterium]|nr:hypothetical protein [Alphaproteobacteria bacterium]
MASGKIQEYADLLTGIVVIFLLFKGCCAVRDKIDPNANKPRNKPVPSQNYEFKTPQQRIIEHFDGPRR